MDLEIFETSSALGFNQLTYLLKTKKNKGLKNV